MKKSFIIILLANLLFISCSPLPIVNSYWRAEEFKDLDKPTDVLIIKVDKKLNIVTFKYDNNIKIEKLHNFKKYYHQLTLPNDTLILVRHPNKNLPKPVVSK